MVTYVYGMVSTALGSTFITLCYLSLRCERGYVRLWDGLHRPGFYIYNIVLFVLKV